MEKQLSYFPVIPLKEMALRRIAVVLVNKPEYLAEAEKFPLGDYIFALSEVNPDSEDPYNYRKEWLETFSVKITDTTSKLLLPVSLTSEMIPILKSVGSELLRWRIFHTWFVSNFNKDFSGIIAEKLCWTTAGTADYRKTSEKLMRSSVLDRVQRFELACLHCLEDYIPNIWKELSEKDKRTFYYNKKVPLEVDAPHLQLLLPYILKKHPLFHGVSLAKVRRDPLKYAALCGNKAATEYCQANSGSSLFTTAQSILLERYSYYARGALAVPGEQLSDVLRYLLSLMTSEEQLRIFKEHPCEVLRCFLAWPSHDLFLDIADVICTFLPEHGYWSLLNEIESHMEVSGYYLPNIVQEFFLRSPRNVRKEFADRFYFPFFEHFFYAEDSQTIRVVFRSLDAADRVRLVFDEVMLGLFDDFLLKDGWHLVEVCIREASLSREDREKMKEAYAESVRTADEGNKLDWRTQKRKRLFEFLDEMDASTGNKRSAEDEAVTRVKKVCNDANDTLPRN